MGQENFRRGDQQVIRVRQGDSIEILKALPDASIGAVITDPPYGISFMGKNWDDPTMLGEHVAEEGEEPLEDDGEGVEEEPEQVSASQLLGFQKWAEVWLKECHRVLVPGGMIKVFSATRTYHRIAVALENVGFSQPGMEAWVYSSGFPKSLNVSKALDKLSDTLSNKLSKEEAAFCRWMQETSGISEAQAKSLLGSDRFLTGKVEVTNTAAADKPPRLARRAMVPTAEAWQKIRHLLAVEPPDWVEALVKAPPVISTVPIDWTPGKGKGTEGTNAFAGYGTALKPAWEIFLVARKAEAK